MEEVGNANGNGLPRLPRMGGRGKYRRMDAEANEEEAEGEVLETGRSRGNESRRYVFACAVFASLNNVLLGYGENKAPCRFDFLNF